MTVAISAVLSAAISAGSLYVYHERYATRIAMIDLPEYVRRIERGMVDKRLSEADADAALDDLERILDAQPPHTVVLTRDVVLRNGREIGLPELVVRVGR